MKKELEIQVANYIIEGHTIEEASIYFQKSISSIKKYLAKIRNENLETYDSTLAKKLKLAQQKIILEGQKKGGSLGKRPKTRSKEEIQKLAELYSSGHTYDTLSFQTNIPRSTLHEAVKSYEKEEIQKAIKESQNGSNLNDPVSMEKQDLKINWKNLYWHLALTYRLSLKSMLKITKQSQEEIFKDYIFKSPAFYYLLQYETVGEDEQITIQKEKAANRFLATFQLVREKKDKQMLLSFAEKLIETDKKFQEVQRKSLSKEKLNTEDYQVLANYQLKYALPAKYIAQELGISEKSLIKQERNILNESQKYQLNQLLEYTQQRYLCNRSNSSSGRKQA